MTEKPKRGPETGLKISLRATQRRIISTDRLLQTLVMKERRVAKQLEQLAGQPKAA